MPTLVNLTGFHLLWVTLLWGAYNQMEAFAIGALLVWLAVHFYFSRYRWSDLRVLGCALVLGTLNDTLLMHLGFLSFVGYTPVSGLPPLWIVAMWANFSLLMNHALHDLRHRPKLTALLGVVSAPVAYWCGAALGAATLGEPLWLTLLALGAAWGVVLPILMQASRTTEVPA